MQDRRYKTGRELVIIEAAVEYFVAILISGAFLARVTKALGFSDSLTGIVSSFVSLGYVFQFIAVALLRRSTHVKRMIILVTIINKILFAFAYFVPAMGLPNELRTVLFLVCFCIAWLLYYSVNAQKTTWHISLVDDKELGRYTARKEIISLIGGMLFTYGMGWLIDTMEAAGNVRGAFIVCACMVLLNAAIQNILSVFVIDTTAEQVQHGSESSVGALLGLMRDKRLVSIVLVNVIWSIAVYAATPFYGAYEIGDLGFSMTFVSVLSVVYSIVRALASPYFGKYADKHSFSRMIYLCFCVALAAFTLNCFTVPANGKIFYTVYYALYAISQAGINSALSNMVFEHVKGEKRKDAFALSYAAAGVAGFLSTCVMSGVVAAIQANGNMLFGIRIYSAQFVSFVAAVLVAGLIVYMKTVILKDAPEHKKPE